MPVPTISELAGIAYAQFERRTRDDDTTYYCVKDDAPDWITTMVYDAHGDMLPDDWKYATVHSALSAIHESGADNRDDIDQGDCGFEFADSNVDVYNTGRTAWLASHLYRPGYVDDAREEGLIGPDTELMHQIGIGQFMESREVFDSVVSSLADRIEELESEEEEEN